MGGSDRGPPGHTSPAGPKWHAPGFSTPFLPRASFPPAPPAPCHASVCGGVAGAGGPNTAGNGEIYGTCSSTVSTPPSLTCTLRIILKTVKDSGTAAEVGLASLGCKKRGGEALADASWGKGGRGRATGAERTEMGVDGRRAEYLAAFMACAARDATLGGVASRTGSKRRGTQLAPFTGWLPSLTDG